MDTSPGTTGSLCLNLVEANRELTWPAIHEHCSVFILHFHESSFKWKKTWYYARDSESKTERKQKKKKKSKEFRFKPTMCL